MVKLRGSAARASGAYETKVTYFGIGACLLFFLLTFVCLYTVTPPTIMPTAPCGDFA